MKAPHPTWQSQAQAFTLRYIGQDRELDISSPNRQTGPLTYDQITGSEVLLADSRIGEPGFLVSRPHLTFQTGPYKATVTLGSEEADRLVIVARTDVVTDERHRVLTGRDVYAYEFSIGPEPHAFSLSSLRKTPGQSRHACTSRTSEDCRYTPLFTLGSRAEWDGHCL